DLRAGSGLRRPDKSNVRSLAGADSGPLNGLVKWNGFQNMTGGNSFDTFVFGDASHVSGSTDGGGGSNILDYTARSTPLVANVSTGTAPQVDGAISHIAAIIPEPLSLFVPSQAFFEGATVSIQASVTSPSHLPVQFSASG